jgi:hypothetical protein
LKRINKVKYSIEDIGSKSHRCDFESDNQETCSVERKSRCLPKGWEDGSVKEEENVDMQINLGTETLRKKLLFGKYNL